MYDLVGFDLRGTGASRPLLDCGADPWVLPQPSYRPVGGPGTVRAANERAWLVRGEAFSRACARTFGTDLKHYFVGESADDLESLRLALGAEKISYSGSGHGPALGQVCTSRHPEGRRDLPRRRPGLRFGDPARRRHRDLRQHRVRGQ